MPLFPDTIRRWARLGANLRYRPPSIRFRASFAGLITAVSALRNAEHAEVAELIKRSDERLKPLGEPLARRIGLNRWLVRAREEAYSDWLKWLFEEMNAEELIKVLGIRELCTVTRPQLPIEEILTKERAHDAVRVARENVVEEGHEGQQGRIDLSLELGTWGLVIVEVKKGNADSADTKKQEGYRKSIEKQFPETPKAFFLLASTSSQPITHDFRFQPYEVFCRNLRRLAIKWIDSQRHLAAAITLTITAAIETNLLGYALDKHSFTASTLRHVQAFVEGADYE
jgi:hypothetical protein